MKVLMINGSPHANGCVSTALMEVAGPLHQAGIETVMFHIGTKPIHGCVACGGCVQTGLCVYDDDPVNACIALATEADGILIGTPVYYAGPNGALTAFLDRMFFMKAGKYAYKPAAVVINCRRGGASATFDRINKYFTISNMPVVPSQYWNATHGLTPEEVKQDLEGLQIMRALGRNMAWMLQCFHACQATYPHPERESWIMTNFIRS